MARLESDLVDIIPIIGAVTSVVLCIDQGGVLINPQRKVCSIDVCEATNWGIRVRGPKIGVGGAWITMKDQVAKNSPGSVCYFVVKLSL